jgi:hypothetical protein
MSYDSESVIIACGSDQLFFVLWFTCTARRLCTASFSTGGAHIDGETGLQGITKADDDLRLSVWRSGVRQEHVWFSKK